MLRKINHGEVVVKEVESIPDTATTINIKENYIVVGESKTIGNDHRVSVSSGTTMYADNGKLYMKNISKEKIYCPIPQRHSEAELPAGSIWEFGIAQEYDYINEVKKNVCD